MITHYSSRNFSRGGCLTAQAIRHYLDGTLKLSDRLMVEEHVRHCRLCSEALKGFRKHHRKNLLLGDLEFLSKRVRQQYAAENPRGSYSLPVILVIALVILLFILVGLFLILRQYQLNQESIQSKPHAVVVITDKEPLRVEEII